MSSLVPRGGSVGRSSRVASFYGAARSDRAYGVNLKWRSPSDLALEYRSAKSAEVLKPSLEVDGDVVSVALADGINDSSAPPGGMFYNLRGRPYDPQARTFG